MGGAWVSCRPSALHLHLQAALEWAGKEGGALGEVKEYISRAVGAPVKELQYEVPEYMKDMVGKHVAIKNSLPPFTCEWCGAQKGGGPADLAL